jgi:protein-S-isoprenylcysteine O-methyltransferase Ste14
VAPQLAGGGLIFGFASMEVLRRGRAAKNVRPAATDRGTSLLIMTAYMLAVLAISSRPLPGVGLSPTIAWVGVVVGIVGFGLRFWAMRVLGRFYTRTLVTTPDQRVVRDGPYRFVRHPGYLGSILIWEGAAASSRNLLSLVAVGVLLAIAYSYRIVTEERMLIEALGEPYLEYSRRSSRLVPFVATVPAPSVVAFVVLYAVAAWLYPGGTKADPNRTGFSFVDNYWCDLLDDVTYGGHPNRARPVAILATLVLSAGMGVLWSSVPVLCPGRPRRAGVARVCGVASAIMTPFIATSFHDLAIDLAGLLGSVAFVATMSALGQRAGRALGVLAAVALALSVVDYVLWRTHLGLAFLPLVQKGAFATFLGWLFVVGLRSLSTPLP